VRTPLVLLPGMMCDARLFEPQIRGLSDVAETWVGDLTRQDTMAALASAVLAEAPFERFALAGLSMGGIVALNMLARSPERIAGLALLDTNHLAETPERQALRQPQIARALGGDLATVLVDEMKPHYFGPAQKGNRSLLDLVLRMGLDLGPHVFERQSLALKERPDASGALSRYPGPVLLLCGEHDRLCPPERHRDMARLVRQAKLVIVPDSGHLSTLEAPDAVTAALRNWLAECSGGRDHAAGWSRADDARSNGGS
jgi:pimeloyl-ACP methyl ester carboxylesterase